ncbi:helix-turn-helix domain-containing protein [Mucilaginibacter paludis]|uniref:Helix-turn-helix domain protein n=1 Tax=Mucilaginibacter paludis DSM 18603 TaxID=714943 RepID=H1Y469_9SPHI|nr:helix-turn-helix transcriptional regulator [Mucilaginibacter paludis]EHQ24805.1 helix-turn-helix domain protein [Mucilaginibacter paludis DSM 18603]
MQEKHSTITFYVDMIYRLQMKRIAAGYTQEELSFLLGYPPDQVGRIERFDTDALVYLTDLNRLAIIFDCELLALAPGYPVSQQKIEILTDHDQDSFRNYYSIYRLGAVDQSELLYKIMEDRPEFACQLKDKEAIQVKIKELISRLITGGSFTKGMEAWDIYQCSRGKMQRRYPPRLLQEVLQKYVSGDRPRLEARTVEKRVTYYVKQG